MTVKVYIDGTVHDPHDARISVFDRGFLYGDSVYEVMRSSGGNLVDFDPHLDRLERSAAALDLTPPPRSVVTEACDATMGAAGASGTSEHYLRIVVTRGAGEIGLDPALADQPGLIVIAKPLELPPQRFYDQGVGLWLVGVQRTPRRAVDPSVKSGNYLNNIMALHEARRHGAYEALMCDAGGRVAEGASSNVFVVRGSEIVTPALEIGLLPGITRQRIIDLAGAAGLPIAEGSLSPEDVRSANEAFITSSIRGVVPVATIDGQPTRTPAVGPTTRRIMELYRAYLAQVAVGDKSARPGPR